jgi:hypothetical protein
MTTATIAKRDYVKEYADHNAKAQSVIAELIELKALAAKGGSTQAAAGAQITLKKAELAKHQAAMAAIKPLKAQQSREDTLREGAQHRYENRNAAWASGGKAVSGVFRFDDKKKLTRAMYVLLRRLVVEGVEFNLDEAQVIIAAGRVLRGDTPPITLETGGTLVDPKDGTAPIYVPSPVNVADGADEDGEVWE